MWIEDVEPATLADVISAYRVFVGAETLEEEIYAKHQIFNLLEIVRKLEEVA